jgi:putative MATE family efflux protein
MCEQMLHMVVALSDVFLTGKVLEGSTDAHLAAVSSMTYILWMVCELFVFVAIGSTAVVARSIGAKKPEEARRATNQSLIMGIGAAIVMTILGIIFGPQVVGLVGLQGDAADLAERYLIWVLPTIPAIMLDTVTIACLRGAGDTLAGLWVNTAVVLVNLVVSWTLCIGIQPIPEIGFTGLAPMGWDGIALGTTCGYFAGGAMGLMYLIGNRGGLGLSRPDLVPDTKMMWRVLRVGIPGGVDIFLIILCQFWFLAIINGLSDPSHGAQGDLPAAAHGIAIRVEGLAYLPAAAFQVAAATMVGQALGAGEPRRASQAVGLALAATMLVTCTGSLVFYLYGVELASLFLQPGQREVAVVAGRLLQIIALGMPALSIVMILNGALRGAGDTRWPVVINLAGFLLFRMPLAYWLAYDLGYGVEGAWWAMLIDLSIRSLMCLARFWHGGWQRVRV